ncbi:hypothetical protein [Bradyrhizobium prioriisuperbiae]|uniref:hypothetical protein n=1 Tax=Bradyrhizobium prioriisuperbiae TaxID=2854389 RepID=UPI0028EF55E8|nr:hypothetical protein [Bradyrhizobium prioritasuperba]
MADKFNPAPIDKHAEHPKDAARKDREQSKLNKDLEHTFPASDPVSETQPSKPRAHHPKPGEKEGH